MPTTLESTGPLAIEWIGEETGYLRLIDQTRLPLDLVYLECREVGTVWEAIKMLRVRGAPAIGIAAAYGLVIGIRHQAALESAARRAKVKEVADYLRSSRPTAVNLFWAMDRMERVADTLVAAAPAEFVRKLLHEAHAIRTEDRDMCAAIGRHGAALLQPNTGVLTHCNAGALATADFGTALSVFFHAHAENKNIRVYVDETRPLLQGSRLTAWELLQRGVPATLCCDNMAGMVMRQGKVQACVVGADRITANGDTANKIGTYSVAVLAKAHGIPFYVAAPSSTFDLSLETGDDIPIEHRDAKEVTHGFGRQTAPEGVEVFNPAFDVTPGTLVTAFITERGIIEPPYLETLRKTLA